ncbi:MAG: hypothetical protein GC206_13100 [Alphaproteobacteria bacterium]|nr:hypothetical protein [Alphaproteobacteria bacterium]
MKFVLAAAAALGFAGLAACSEQADSPATNAEEIGERADTAMEEATTGETNMGDGPMEEAGEEIDEANREAGQDVPADAPPPLDN